MTLKTNSLAIYKYRPVKIEEINGDKATVEDLTLNIKETVDLSYLTELNKITALELSKKYNTRISEFHRILHTINECLLEIT